LLDQLIGGGLLKSVGAIIDSVHTSEDEKKTMLRLNSKKLKQVLIKHKLKLI
jgi:hypothetical protein